MDRGRLSYLDEEGTSREVVLGERTTIGRADDSDIVVRHQTVSRQHALIRGQEDGTFLAIDLGSANGTYLNDRPLVVPTRLRGGDVLRIGAMTFEFRLDEAPEDEPGESVGGETIGDAEPPQGVAVFGTGPAMARVFRQMEQAAASPIPVLIEGETGTGKELVARGIHQLSGRAAGPFLAVNCAALPETLLESELFGHRRGAFTGATQDRRGLFETAKGGTIFLDEVGEMPPAMQPKMLRVLEEGEVTPVGDTRPQKVDVRVISATNRDLLAEVDRGSFRNDLYYRLSAFPISLPALRERREDIPLLAKRFLALAAQRNGKRVRGIDPAALALLTHFDWPGNVRELRNEIQRAVAVVEDGHSISCGQLSAKLSRGTPGTDPGADLTFRVPDADVGSGAGGDATTSAAAAAAAGVPAGGLRGARAEFEARYIGDVLQKLGGNVSRASRVLGLSRVALLKKLKDYGLR
jgi:DNA-binding NtrC family response regulator